MCTKFEMKFNHGLKSMDFKMEGYSEETSVSLISKIMKTITESGNSKRVVSKVEEPKIFEFNNVVREQKEYLPNPQEEIEEEQATIFNSTDEIKQEETDEEQADLFNSDDETHQTFYVCKCGDKGKHRIKRSQIYVNCWKCGKRMRVRDAHMEGFPMKDVFGNIFIAGEFKRLDQSKYGAMVY
ncbi:hypothetical protein [Peribacillus frigoritolerans]|uniref:hypothetical protein n=1 Tax=Peribacillus frigoritolerans TaxID=450367 RepID=UPI00207953EB|nr:hypothetical protein [Peribacillus frigoritolerans]USK77679.1 hypothetical protein LIT31_26350 [Peribacillus frigoritolerans]USK77760.1 hypothetical protein LIT31_25875 [Peribacillus frigoritolerans]USK77907.1 hypothetical protein LIT31_26860 [Peribacillus frigoritolerans]